MDSEKNFKNVPKYCLLTFMTDYIFNSTLRLLRGISQQLS